MVQFIQTCILTILTRVWPTCSSLHFAKDSMVVTTATDDIEILICHISYINHYGSPTWLSSISNLMTNNTRSTVGVGEEKEDEGVPCFRCASLPGGRKTFLVSYSTSIRVTIQAQMALARIKQYSKDFVDMTSRENPPSLHYVFHQLPPRRMCMCVCVEGGGIRRGRTGPPPFAALALYASSILGAR